MSTELPLIARARRHGHRLALVDGAGEHRYDQLLAASERAAARLLAGRSDLEEERVAVLVEPGFAYPALQWAIWRAGGIAVPLAVSHPPAELEHAVTDAAVSAVVADAAHAERLRPLCERHRLPLRVAAELLAEGAAPFADLPELEPQRRATLLYTSGTTSRPKGVVWTHRALVAQLSTLTTAWGWRSDDRTLLVLPLHHVHGIVNVLSSALWAGAVCEMVPRFEAAAVWGRLLAGGLTVFMAVPTVYYKLLALYDEAPANRRAAMERAASALRLAVCGSAALPVPVLERWRRLSGQTLLERYGMTEIGMALSNPLAGERCAGTVGRPLPGVQVRIVDEAGQPVPSGTPGELEVKGESVFSEYWRRPTATAEAFRPDGWFRTGDEAMVDPAGRYRILGRQSVDIIKSGGYKISALEVEAVLAGHPAVERCAVVGLPDPEWGERVAAAVVPAAGGSPQLAELRAWAEDKLAPYKLPRRLLLLDELPVNALGKVVKPRLVERFAAEEEG